VDTLRATGDNEPKTGMVAFDRLVAQVMHTEQNASVRRVAWVVINGFSHWGQASIRRLEGRCTRRRHRRLRLIHTPIHSSWLHQVEIYFSIVDSRFTPNDFADLGEVKARLLAFERRYEAAEPFEWKFTRKNLHALMKRLAARQVLLPAA
jgi:hypothetical protein